MFFNNCKTSAKICKQLANNGIKTTPEKLVKLIVDLSYKQGTEPFAFRKHIHAISDPQQPGWLPEMAEDLLERFLSAKANNNQSRFCSDVASGRIMDIEPLLKAYDSFLHTVA
jgi:hypothetical protein